MEDIQKDYERAKSKGFKNLTSDEEFAFVLLNDNDENKYYIMRFVDGHWCRTEITTEDIEID